jgi:gamma-glutamyltranspeptidase/glutathione hydrolase
MTSRFLPTIAALAAMFTATLILPAGAPALLRDASPGAPYSLTANALLGPTQTDLYLTVTSTGVAPPAELGLIQVKVFAESGEHLRTETFHDVAAPGGKAQVALNGVERKQVLEVKAHAKEQDQNNIEARATVLRRPDLTVVATAPLRVVRTHPFTLNAKVTELGGDTGADATVALVEGGATIATQAVTVAAGGNATIAFPLQYGAAAEHTLSAVVSEARPAESDVGNNAARTTIKVARYDFDGAVTSDEPEATRVGLDVLQGGGNAVDAAVAMQFALAVTQPQNVGLGGGATIVLHLEGKGDFALDAREISSAQTTPRQFLVPGTNTMKTNANSSGFSVGVPGSLKVAEDLLRRWGTTTLSDSLKPAIGLAANGFTVSKALSDATAPGRRCQNIGQPETKALYCSGAGLPVGSTFTQPDLAKSFRLIADQGTDVFYRGEIASAIVEAQHRTRVPDGTGVGTMTLADLASYTVNADERPITVKYHDHDLVSIGASSDGGYIALQALKMIDLRRADFPFGDVGRGFGWMAPDTAHVMTEAIALAFADHFYWMGDGAVPRDELLSDCYVAERAALIRLDARIPRVPVVQIRPVGDPFACNRPAAADLADFADESADHMTSHFSVLDKWGNAVSFTTTLTDAFGTGILVPGYGIVLNDALSNFNPVPTAKPGAFPTPGDPGINDAGPSKRARGNTAPLIALKNGEPVLITGSPGGAFIPSVVMNVVTNVFDFGMPVQEAVNAPRMWWNMSTVLWNAGIPDATIAHLRAFGNTMQGPMAPPQVGGAESIAVDPVTFAVSAAKDRLIPDASAELIAPS